jgi:hypothetical protein
VEIGRIVRSTTAFHSLHSKEILQRIHMANMLRTRQFCVKHIFLSLSHFGLRMILDIEYSISGFSEYTVDYKEVLSVWNLWWEWGS